MDIFDTRVMLRAIELMLAPRTFLLETFFTVQETHNTEFVEVDIFKGKRRMAPFQRPIHEGKVMQQLGFKSNSIRVPYVKPKMRTRAADMLKRMAGETIYDARSPADRAREQLAKDLQELMEIITRREEWMAAQALITGKVTITGDEIDAEIDFLRDAAHNITLTGTDLWDDAAATIDSDLVAWRSLIAKATGLTARNAVLGSDVVEEVLHNADVQKLVDNRRTEAGLLRAGENPIEGVIYVGNLRGIDLFSYEEWYIDDAGVEQPMIPADRVVLGADGMAARNTRHYAAIQDLEATAVTRFFPKSWEEKDPSVRWAQVQSAPLPATHTPDAFVSAKVL